jgi:hypothetical protein
MLRRVALVGTDVSDELSASFIRVTRIGELGTTILFTLMKEALCLFETSVPTRATRRKIQEDTILDSHRRDNLKSYKIDATMIGISKVFDLVLHDRLLRKIAASGVDPMVAVWITEFLLGRTQRVRVGGQLSEEVGVRSGVPQGSVLGSLLFLAYVNDIW